MLITNQTIQDYWFGPLHLAAGVGSTLVVDDTSATSLYLTDDGVADAINTLYASGKIQQTGAATPFPRATGVPTVLHGDGSPEGIIYGGQGSVFIRRDSGSLYTKKTGIHLNTGWSSIAQGSITTSGLFSAGPPGSAGDGDVWEALAVDTSDLSTTSGTVWMFRYNASSSSTYKWEFIGGSPYQADGNPNSALNALTQVGASGYYYDAATMAWTAARAGDYIIDGGVDMDAMGQGNPGNASLVPFKGSSITTGRMDNDTTSSNLGSIFAAKRVTGVAASTVIGVAASAVWVGYHVDTSYVAITPVRVS